MVKYMTSTLNATFAALADPTRRAILERLSEGQAQVIELAEPFGMSLPAVSKHLRVLEKASLIRRTVEGRIHRFTVNPIPLSTAQSWIDEYQQFREQRLDAWEHYLEKTTHKEK